MAERTVRVTIAGNSEQAQRAFHELQEAASKAGIKMAEDTEKSSGRIGGGFKSIIGGAVALGAAYLSFGAIKGVLTDATAAFGEQQTATVLLNQAMKDTGQKWTPSLNAALSTSESQMLKFGDTTAGVENALGILVRRGVPASASIADLGEIANIAAIQHVTLADATTEVAKATAGRMMPALKLLGAETLPKGVTGVKALNLIMAEMKGHVAGAADAVSHTMPGAMAAFGAAIKDKVMVPIGALIDKGLIAISQWVSAHSKDISNVLTGAMDLLGAAVQVVVDVFGFIIKNFQTFGPLLLAAGAALLVYQGIVQGVALATKIWTGIQALFNLTMEANPVTIVALAIAGIVAAIVIAYTKVSWFRDGMNTIWKIIGGYVGVVTTVIGGIVGAVKDIIGWSGWATIGALFSRVFGGIATAIGAVVTVIEDIVTGIKDVIQWLGSLGSSHEVAGLRAPKGSSSNAAVPLGVRAGGGQVSAGQSYLMGENGPEIYTVNASGYVTPNSMLNANGPSVGGGNTTYITVNTNDPQAVVNALKKYEMSNGSVPITARRSLSSA